MKLCAILFSVLFIYSSCSEERGAVEVENLSKKVFESIRKNDEQKFYLNLPNQNGFEKIQSMVKDTSMVSYENYADFKNTSKLKFEQLYNTPFDWSECTFANSLDTIHKHNPIVLSKVVVKFKENKNAHKFQFQAIKLDGQWYYYSGLMWIHNEPDVL